MKAIGKRVHLIPPTAANPRSGEGDFIRLPDGRIMYAYSDYYTNEGHDHSPSQISAVFSSDEGESFGDYRVLIPPSEDIVNRMCVSFLEMQNGEIGMFYGEKYISASGKVFMRYMLTRTKDGKTFSEPKNCTEGIEYSVFENARVIRLSSGRILIPSNHHPYHKNGDLDVRGVFELFYSDDDGESFKKAPFRIENPLKTVPSGLQETGLCEIEDGKVLAFSRTDAGTQFVCTSQDGGESFTTPEPSPYFTSPCSPLHMRHIGEDKTVAVWNPIPAMPAPYLKEMHVGWSKSRTPLACAILSGKGEGFLSTNIYEVPAKIFLLEDDFNETYCYPAVFAEKDYFLCAYYHSFGTGKPLSACVIKKVLFSEITEQ